MVIQASRVYGNISKFPDIWPEMESMRVTELFCMLLDHANPDIVYQTAGVLMNISNDSRQIEVILGVGGLQKLVEVLENTLDNELGLAVCKVLSNLVKNADFDGEMDDEIAYLVQTLKNTQKDTEVSEDLLSVSLSLLNFLE
jgi:uncharacterized protein YihD (DUF1040 family)